MNWNQPICGNCWDKLNPNRRAVVATDMNPERCAYCNAGTREGIYIRDDPATVPYPTEEAEDMTDPVEPPELAMWKQEWRISASVLLAAQRERDEARRLLEAALLDLEVDAPNGAYMPGELPDQIRAFLAGTSGGFHTEEPKT